MSKQTHIPFVAEYDEQNQKEVFTEGRHIGAMVKQSVSKANFSVKYWILLFAFIIGVIFTQYLSKQNYAYYQENTNISSFGYSFGSSSSASQLKDFIQSDIDSKEKVSHLNFDQLDQLMLRIIERGIDSARDNPVFIQTHALGFSSQNKPGKIIYAKHNTEVDSAIFTTTIALTPLEIYPWAGILRRVDGELKLTQLINNKELSGDKDYKNLFTKKIDSADVLTDIRFQSDFIYDLDDAHSFTQAIDVMQEIVVSQSAAKDLITVDVASKGIQYLVEELNRTGSIPEGINSRNITFNELKKEGLIDMTTMNSFGQIKVIDVNPSTKFILGAANKAIPQKMGAGTIRSKSQGSLPDVDLAVVFGGFLKKKDGVFRFEALDFAKEITIPERIDVDFIDVIDADADDADGNKSYKLSAQPSYKIVVKGDDGKVKEDTYSTILKGFDVVDFEEKYSEFVEMWKNSNPVEVAKRRNNLIQYYTHKHQQSIK